MFGSESPSVWSAVFTCAELKISPASSTKTVIVKIALSPLFKLLISQSPVPTVNVPLFELCVE